jgi:uncharacterized protein
MRIAQNLMDGKQLYYIFLAGSYNIFENQKLLNKINVFPVPDADTGTNLASTFRSIIENTIPSNSIKQTSVAIAEAALSGARGNSGIIIAQFLYGFSNELEDREQITLKDFAISMKKAVEYAYNAIAEPVEGTIITVLREWAEFIYMLHEKFENFEQLLRESLIKAQESLAKTPEMLKILATSNVVDAGAKGFVIFLEGIIEFFQKHTLKKIMSFSAQALDSIKIAEAEEHQTSHYRYCTEALITLSEPMEREVKDRLKTLGDSLVIAGHHKKMRIHIHTNEPSEVMGSFTKGGRIISQKVDDMFRQNDIAANRKHNIGLVIDSTCDLPAELADKHQITVVPLNVFFGEQQFLDRVTITQKKFFDMMETSPDYPTSSQPSLKDIQNTFNYLSTHYESIIAIHLSEKLSGTYANSLSAAESISEKTGKRIDVVNSRQLSGTFGLLALRTAESIEQGWSHDQIMDKIHTWSYNSRVLVGTQSLDSFIRGGRVSATKGYIGKLLGARPIVSMDKEGKALLLSKAYSLKGSLKKKKVLKEHALNKIC